MSEETTNESRVEEAARTEHTIESQGEVGTGSIEETASKERAGDQDSQLQKEPPKKGNKAKVLIIVAVLLVCAVAGGFYATQVLKPSQDYQKAVDLYKAGDYEEAVEAFSSNPEYEDSMSYVYSAYKKLAGQDYVDKATLGLEYMNNYIEAQATAVRSFALSFYSGSDTEASWSPDLNDANLKNAEKTKTELVGMKRELDRVFTEEVLESCNDETLRTAYDQFNTLHDSVTSMLSTQKAMTYINDMMSGSSSTVSSDTTTAKSAMTAYTSTLNRME